jgi:hypothetical protein
MANDLSKMKAAKRFMVGAPVWGNNNDPRCVAFSWSQRVLCRAIECSFSTKAAIWPVQPIFDCADDEEAMERVKQLDVHHAELWRQIQPLERYEAERC